MKSCPTRPVEGGSRAPVEDVDALLGDTTVMVLAGGLGTRLRDSVPDLPKALAPVAGRPFLARLLEQIEQTGYRRVILCTGHLASQIESRFGTRFGSIELSYSPEIEPLGTGGALRQAMPDVDTRLVLALNGDSFCNVDLADFLIWASGRGARAALVAARVPDASRFGRLAITKDGRVYAFHEKDGKSQPGWINAGIYAFESSLLRSLPKTRPLSLEREVLEKRVDAGLVAYCSDGAFLDIGTPESFSAAQSFFATSPEEDTDHEA
jgi:D-glycero-alpha-D-manno-heptose 1-phosphate guanylyltransferase